MRKGTVGGGKVHAAAWLACNFSLNLPRRGTANAFTLCTFSSFSDVMYRRFLLLLVIGSSLGEHGDEEKERRGVEVDKGKVIRRVCEYGLAGGGGVMESK